MFLGLAKNLIKGLGLGIGIATALTMWSAILYRLLGSSPVDQPALVADVRGYYLGGFTGGVLIGFCWPLSRWLLGYLALGMIGVFPLFLFAPGRKGGVGVLNADNLATSLFGAFFVGGGAGLFKWLHDHPRGPTWFDALRYPTGKMVIRVWATAVLVASLSWYLVPKWSAHWPVLLVAFAAGILFVVPLLIAFLVLIQYTHDGSDSSMKTP